MKASKLLITSLSALSFISISTIPHPAKAAVSCKAGTASNFSNGSLQSCILDFNANIGLSNNYFSCSQDSYIQFDQKGQFESCTLSQELRLRQGNEVVTCPVNAIVYVEILDSGNQEIECSRISSN